MREGFGLAMVMFMWGICMVLWCVGQLLRTEQRPVQVFHNALGVMIGALLVVTSFAIYPEDTSYPTTNLSTPTTTVTTTVTMSATSIVKGD